MRICLICCNRDKQNKPAKAEDMYTSWHFKLKMRAAKATKCDKYFILSGKYGLLELDEIIEPYNSPLNYKIVKEWANKVVKQLKDKHLDLENDEFVFFASPMYYKELVPYFKHYKIVAEHKNTFTKNHIYKEIANGRQTI